MRARLPLALFWFVFTGCTGRGGDPVPRTSPPTTPAAATSPDPDPAPAAVPSTPPAGAQPTPAGAQPIELRRVERLTCAEPSYEVRDVEVHVTERQLWFVRDRGGGCPRRASYTVLARGGDPLEVAVCYDPDADKCEAVLKGERVAIDLTPALVEAGASAARVVRAR